MIKIEMKGFDEVQRSLRRLPKELHEKAIRPAINKTAEKARAEINRAISQEYAVKASEVRQAVDLRRSSGTNLQAVIDVFGSKSRRGRSANLIHFLAAIQAAGRAIKARGAKASKRELADLNKQLGFLIKRGGGLKKIEGAFVGNKGRTIFQRNPGAQMNSRPGNLTKHSQAITPLQVIGFSQMFNSRKINSRVLDKVRTELPIEIDRAIKMVLSK